MGGVDIRPCSDTIASRMLGERPSRRLILLRCADVSRTASPLPSAARSTTDLDRMTKRSA
eukprot:7605908-Pyramimonas_sp.AAC.1